MSTKSRLHLRIYGHVQGVFFRATARERAGQLDIVGWIKNTPEQSVEMLLEGERESLEEFLQWCYAGPDLAIVRNIEVKWGKYTGEFKDIIVSQ